ncbi:hypothetical protein GUA87_00475 [Sneathiella sp. P13V-1]|uniref:hypothetical protein n=1 Tax=Sneathiella sp. P13V-1 TaxID=2697366 RepID=UPI00187B61A6|nr:hypothetical protein [Sneathiella sp. P13V-1]MBE7635302.1 hypothetical protein [Sneathiella sp. P13V-1]
MKKIIVVLSLLVLGACSAGADFNRVENKSVALGKTTIVEIQQKLGAPYASGKEVKNGATLDVLSYSFADTKGDPLEKDVVAARTQSFYFSNDVLVGQVFTSSFKSDATDFDTSLVGKIQKNKSTVSEVRALLGKETGKRSEPMTNGKAEAIVYYYVATRAFGLKFTTKVKELVVEYDKSSQLVLDVQLKETTDSAG